MKWSTGLRGTAAAALGVALLVAWNLLKPGAASMLVDQLGADALNLLTRPYFHLGEIPVTPVFLLEALLFLAALTFASRFIRKFVRRRILDRTSIDEGQKYAMSRGAGYITFLVGLTIGLQSAGLDLSSLAVIGGAIGLGIGFGLQTVAKNFVSGIILLAERPIKVGDRVEVGSLNGDVVRIGARSTWVRTNDNVVIIVPNSEFTDNRVTNWTAHERKVRFKVPFGVSYKSVPDQVREVVLDVALSHPDVLTEPGPDVIFIGFGDSSLNFELRVWTSRQIQTPNVLRSDLYFAIFRAFGENGIEIPFPQRDLHLRSIAAPMAALENAKAAVVPESS